MKIGVALFFKDPLKPLAVANGFEETLVYLSTQHSSLYADIPDIMDRVETSLNIPKAALRAIDSEGRVICAFIPERTLCVPVDTSAEMSKKPVVVMSIYSPRVNRDDPKRVEMRQHFDKLFTFCVELFLRR